MHLSGSASETLVFYRQALDSTTTNSKIKLIGLYKHKTYMELHKKQTRFLEFYRHLIELASENFSTRLHITGKKDDEIETFGLLLNMLAQRLQTLYNLHAPSLRKKLPDLSFLINEDRKIIFVSPDAISAIKSSKEQLFGKDFTTVLTSSSQQFFLDEMMKIDNELFHEKYHELHFKDKADAKISSYSFWYTAFNEGGARLISVHCNFKKAIKKIKETGNSLLLKEDWDKIRAFHNYILNHLYENLPSMSELAKIADLNEYKLKMGFKELYKISIFRFQTRERMSHAELLVKNTLMPIKQISQHLGYRDSSHFSTIFKKHFGTSPKKFRNQNRKDSP